MTVTADIATDLLTPLGAYLRLRERAGTRGAFLLESVERGRLGRYSFVGCGSRLVSFAEAEELGVPVVGYLPYDYVATLEPTVRLPTEGPSLPENTAVVPELLVRFDHARGVAQALIGAPEQVAAALAAPQPELPRGTGKPGPLRRVNPSPYLFLLELDDIALVGSSPETVVKCAGSRAELNPIAGTIAPGEGDAEALLSSEKDRAEHVMLVDLGRNDLSRVCVPGSVRVEL